MNKKKRAKLSRSELESYFKLIGANDTEFYAAEEANGEPALARTLLLRGLSRCVNHKWLEQPSLLESELAQGALKKLRSVVTQEELTALSYAVQRLAIWNATCLLDDSLSGIEDLQDAIAPHVAWGVYRVDENEAATGRIGGLHEDLESFLPSGPKQPRNKRSRPTKR
jgi:hypothetical protein